MLLDWCDCRAVEQWDCLLNHILKFGVIYLFIYLYISNPKERDKKDFNWTNIYDDDDEKKARLLHSWQRNKPRLWRARK